VRRHASCSTAALAAVLATAALATPAVAQHIRIDPPGDREFIVDLADFLEPAHEQKVRQICDKTLTDTAAPIIVVTIRSMANHCDIRMRIESFAMLLFNQWGIGHEKINGVVLNHGILLLVSQDDRKARIELGAGWGRTHDVAARQIMDGHIVPRFKGRDFSGGILAGVTALDKLARGFEIPRPPRPWWHYALVVGVVALAAWTFVSLARRGAGGWAWLFWAAVFGMIGFFLHQLLTSRSSGGGVFSGGSFGGGFSGGGGATGSW
jgi:uncharacterized protein